MTKAKNNKKQLASTIFKIALFIILVVASLIIYNQNKKISAITVMNRQLSIQLDEVQTLIKAKNQEVEQLQEIDMVNAEVISELRGMSEVALNNCDELRRSGNFALMHCAPDDAMGYTAYFQFENGWWKNILNEWSPFFPPCTLLEELGIPSSVHINRCHDCEEYVSELTTAYHNVEEARQTAIEKGYCKQ